MDCILTQLVVGTFPGNCSRYTQYNCKNKAQQQRAVVRTIQDGKGKINTLYCKLLTTMELLYRDVINYYNVILYCILSYEIICKRNTKRVFASGGHLQLIKYM